MIFTVELRDEADKDSLAGVGKHVYFIMQPLKEQNTEKIKSSWYSTFYFFRVVAEL